MQKEEMRRNIILQACEGDIHLGHTHFVHEHVLGLITSGEAEHYTPEGVTTYPAGTLCLFRRIQLMKTIKKTFEGKGFTTINIFLDQEP